MLFMSLKADRNVSNVEKMFYLFSEVDSPFWIDSEEKIRNLKIYRIPLRNDLILSANVGFGNTDEWLKEYGKIVELDLGI